MPGMVTVMLMLSIPPNRDRNAAGVIGSGSLAVRALVAPSKEVNRSAENILFCIPRGQDAVIVGFDEFVDQLSGGDVSDRRPCSTARPRPRTTVRFDLAELFGFVGGPLGVERGDD
jgi:hypothetical protein